MATKTGVFVCSASSAGLAVLAWRLVQFWMPIPLGGISYASLKLGPLGRRRRLEAMRSLAAEAKAHATERVWDAPITKPDSESSEESHLARPAEDGSDDGGYSTAGLP